MEIEIQNRLLEAVLGCRLSIFCGAGLSMAAPSTLPSAYNLAKMCWDNYRNQIDPTFDPTLKYNLELLAEYFIDRGKFINTFIQLIVPWDKLRSQHNSGHEAIADFLGSGIIEYTISLNYDVLIENAVEHLGGGDFNGSIEPYQIFGGINAYKQLQKIHGCCRRDVDNTVWSKKQLIDTPLIQKRISEYTAWLNGRISGNDILIIGFWSDWAYLNDIFLNAHTNEPRSVILVDPDTPANLQTKAPALWAWANGTNVWFRHVQAYSESFLDELRRIVSASILRKMFENSFQIFQQTIGKTFTGDLDYSGMTSTELYNLRRNFEGKPSNKISRAKNFVLNYDTTGLAHLKLIDKGATLTNSVYEYKGSNIRLIFAAGKLLSTVQAEFSKEPPLPVNVDFTICIGSILDKSAINIIRPLSKPSIVASGFSGNWGNEMQLDLLLN